MGYLEQTESFREEEGGEPGWKAKGLAKKHIHITLVIDRSVVMARGNGGEAG